MMSNDMSDYVRKDVFDARMDRLEAVLEKNLIQFRIEMNERFNQMDSRFDKLNLETRLGNVEARIGNVEARIGNVEARIGNVETRMTGLESRMGDSLVFFGAGFAFLTLLLTFAPVVWRFLERTANKQKETAKDLEKKLLEVEERLDTLAKNFQMQNHIPFQGK